MSNDELHEHHVHTIETVFSALYEHLNDAVLAAKCCESLGKRFAGSLVYYPKHDIERRNRIIYARFNGRNHQDLSIEFKLSKKQIYQIIREQMNRRRNNKFSPNFK